MFPTSHTPKQSFSTRPAGSLTTKHVVTLPDNRRFTWLPDPEHTYHNTEDTGLYICQLADLQHARLEIGATFDRTTLHPYRVHVMAYLSNDWTGHITLWAAQLAEEPTFDDLSRLVLDRTGAVLHAIAEDLCPMIRNPT